MTNESGDHNHAENGHAHNKNAQGGPQDGQSDDPFAPENRNLILSWINANSRIDVCDPKDIQEHRDSKVIYQVYPSSFNDSSGNGIGDIAGIREKLDYIKSLNVDAQWTSPFYPSHPGPEGDGGYAVDDYTAIDPKFGTLDDFKAMLKDSHDKDLLQYIDFVLCHTSWAHEWFEESRKDKTNDKADWFVWHDGLEDEDGNPIPPNNWKSVFGGRAWSYDGNRHQWYMHHFLDSQPALNLNNPVVVDAIIEKMKFWTELLSDDQEHDQDALNDAVQHSGINKSADGVDGFRLDALPFANYDDSFENNPWRVGTWPHLQEEWWNQRFDHSMCQEETIEVVAKIRGFLEEYDQKRDALGEVIAGPEGGNDSVPVAASYVDRFEGLDYCYTNALMGSEGYPNAWDLRGTINYVEEHFPDGGNCNTVSNHDFKRAWSRWVGDLDESVQETAYRQMMTLYATLPGSLCLYQGDELGLSQAVLYDDIPEDMFKDPVFLTQGAGASRDGCRTPMPWKHDEKNAGFSTSGNPYLPVPASHYERAVDVQEADPNSTLHFTRDLLEWRREQPALVRGYTIVIENDSPVLAFIRRSKDQTLLCLYNVSDQEQEFRPADYLGDKLMEELDLHKNVHYRLAPYASEFAGEMIEFLPEVDQTLDRDDQAPRHQP